MQAEQSNTTIVASNRIRRIILLALLATLAVAALALLLYYLTTGARLSRLPGTRLARNMPPTYSYSIFGVDTPAGVAVSADGRLVYVANHGGGGQVRVFDRRGELQYSLTPPGGVGSNGKPMYVAVGPDGQVYVSDYTRHEVEVYSAGGEYLGAVRSPDGTGTWAPVGVSVDSQGTLFVADRAAEPLRVVAFDPDFRVRTTYLRPPSKSSDMQSVGAVAVDSNGRVFVANGLAATVEVFSPDGRMLPGSDVGSFKIALPQGLAIDTQNRLYAVDSINSEVHVYDLASTPTKELFKFGAAGTDDQSFAFPVGIAVDATGRVYVADQANQRVQVWSY